jgi:hypothetical protein
MSEVDAKPASISLEPSKIKFDNHCWSTKEFIVLKQRISLLLEPIIDQ